MDLPVVVAERPYVEHCVARFCLRETSNTTSIVGMAFLYVVFLPQHLGDIPIGLLYWYREFRFQSSQKCVTHDAHESSIAKRFTALFTIQADYSGVECLVAMLAQNNQIVGCVPTGLAALQMMNMQPNRLLFCRVSTTALACVVITLQDVLANIVFVVHLAELIVPAHWKRLAFQHSFQPLGVKFYSLYSNECYWKNLAHTLDNGGVLLNFDFHRRRQPALVLAVYPVVETRCPVPGFAVPATATVLPPHREQFYYVVAGGQFFFVEFSIFCAGGKSHMFGTSVHAQNDGLFVSRTSVQEFDHERRVLYNTSLFFLQKQTSLPWRARHQRLAMHIKNVHILHDTMLLS